MQRKADRNLLQKSSSFSQSCLNLSKVWNLKIYDNEATIYTQLPFYQIHLTKMTLVQKFNIYTFVYWDVLIELPRNDLDFHIKRCTDLKFWEKDGILTSWHKINGFQLVRIKFNLHFSWQWRSWTILWLWQLRVGGFHAAAELFWWWWPLGFQVLRRVWSPSCCDQDGNPESEQCRLNHLWSLDVTGTLLVPVAI